MKSFYRNLFCVIPVGIVLFFSLSTLFGAEEERLPRALPGETLPSEATDAFLRNFRDNKMDLHSVMVLKNGKVVYEKWLGDNAPEKKHVLWSATKAFTCMAVGFAVQEKLLQVEDKVISFFPEDLPKPVSENLSELRIKHLLTMTVGQEADLADSFDEKSRHWEKQFLAQPFPDEPGSRFLYNSMASCILSSIIRKTSGQNLSDYLDTRLFKPLGIVDYVWEKNSDGLTIGGWGLFLKTEDMAKLGQFMLQNGKWNGRQLLEESWLKEARASHIVQNPGISPRWNKSDWNQGFGYQLWRCRHKGFHTYGRHGQFILVLPEQNAVVTLTADLEDMKMELVFVWNDLLPVLTDDQRK